MSGATGRGAGNSHALPPGLVKDMTQKKVLFIPLLSNTIFKVETILSEQAAQGWIVEKIDWKGLHFVKRRPLNRKYVFYRLASLRRQVEFDQNACRIATALTSAFPATNTVKVQGGDWYLVSFVPDNNLPGYHELLNRRDQFLFGEAKVGLAVCCAFCIITFLMLAMLLSDVTRKGTAILFSLFNLMGVVGVIKETDACIRLYRRLHKK